MAYTYRCRDHPGTEVCPAAFTAQIAAEIMKHVELHAIHVHGEEPQKWSSQERQQFTRLIRPSLAGAALLSVQG